MTIDLVSEQQATLARPRYRYSLPARLLFAGMNLLAGRKATLPKAKLLEILACIPYREWERRQYGRMTHGYRNSALVQQARQIVDYGRHAQDNEYWHLLVIHEKMQEDGLKDPWFLAPVITRLMVWTYVLMARILACLSIRRAYLFNAEFEDHAEHEYAQFVHAHPEWENQPAQGPIANANGAAGSWADVFRRIGLDERDHRNSSFVLCGRPEDVVPYEGMPAS